jgi:rare lipoprotein A
MLARARTASLAALTIGLMAAAPQAKASPPGHSGDSVIQTGQASWYGRGHNGRRTSSGAVFDDRELTAAHPSLPLGTQVKVTSETSGRSVVVTINDRQPDHGRRIIDLSRAAAAKLGMLGSGTASVTLAIALPTDVAQQEAEDAPLEVAEAPEDPLPIAQPHGRRQTRHVARVASAGHPCCRAPSVIPARHSVQPRAARHKL